MSRPIQRIRIVRRSVDVDDAAIDRSTVGFVRRHLTGQRPLSRPDTEELLPGAALIRMMVREKLSVSPPEPADRRGLLDPEYLVVTVYPHRIRAASTKRVFLPNWSTIEWIRVTRGTFQLV